MVDVFSTTATMANNASVTNVAYDLMIRKPLRAKLWFDPVATISSTKQSHNGASVTFFFTADLAVATTPLSEIADVDAVAISDTILNVTMAEYGNAVVTTAKLRGHTAVSVDPVAAERIARNAAISIDTLARTAMEATSNSVADTGLNLTAGDVRSNYVNLVENFVDPWDGEFYLAFIHPRQALDLRAATALSDWRAPQVYGSDNRKIMTGEIGEFEGFRFIVTPRISTTGSGATGTLKSLWLGSEALAKAFSRAPGFSAMPSVVLGEVTDKLKRFQPVGWYWLGGYKVFRSAACRQYITRCSLGT